MTTTDLSQLELLARIDELTERLAEWARTESPWEPINRERAFIARVLARVDGLRLRLEAPLVAAVFGGTGTGKSTLINALAGQECTATGRQRPTTKKPVLIAHPDTIVEALAIPLDVCDVVRIDAPFFRDVVLIDCPDPDTAEAETPGSQLEKLHRLLPGCDVLIYVSTQQKYCSARVADEVGQAAGGCRLLFVQTHADVDDDIRADWRKHLAADYEVPDLFFVDSLQALAQQRDNRRSTGEFGRLQELLVTHAVAGERIRVRRANLLDVLHAALEHCRNELSRGWQSVEQLEGALADERQKLSVLMSNRLNEELLASRHLWERRLVGAVTDNWGYSPFSTMLRLYNGLGSVVAGLTMYRARSAAHMALIGAVQGVRWLNFRREETRASARLERLETLALDDTVLAETRLAISGYVKDARLDPALAARSTLDELKGEAGRVEMQFLGRAGRCIDDTIATLAAQNSRWYVRAVYEALFSLYVGFVLVRVGKNFFYDTFLKELFWSEPARHVELLSFDFYLSAGLFFVLWTGLLVMAFARRLRSGLNRMIEELSRDLAGSRLDDGLFPRLEQACRDIDVSRARLLSAADAVAELRQTAAVLPAWGAAHVPSVNTPPGKRDEGR